MNKKELLKTIISDSQSRVLPTVWSRTLTIPVDSTKIVTLTGVRRSGKTYHLFDIMNQLKANGVSPERLLYINFEDERLHLGRRRDGCNIASIPGTLSSPCTI